MIAKRSLAFAVALLIAVVAVSCSSSVNDGASDTETPQGVAATATPTATDTPIPTATTSALATRAATKTAPTALAPSPTPAIVDAAPEFVNNPDCQQINRARLPLADVVIGDGTRFVAFTAEMAVTTTQQSQGLMCRVDEPDSTRMLFIWDDERNGGFWMFNTYAPLDIIYFGAQDGSVSFKQMAPCPRSEGESNSDWGARCGQESAEYSPGIPYTTTLELPQGWLESQGFDTDNPSTIDISFTARD